MFYVSSFGVYCGGGFSRGYARRPGFGDGRGFQDRIMGRESGGFFSSLVDSIVLGVMDMARYPDEND